MRVHASRRRVLLVVKCVVLLMRGKLRVAPVPRLDRFDFAIYSSLGSEWLKVAEEQQRYMLLRDQVEAATVRPVGGGAGGPQGRRAWGAAVAGKRNGAGDLRRQVGSRRVSGRVCE